MIRLFYQNSDAFLFPCNKKLAEHPTVQVTQQQAHDYRVGLLGILNGVLSKSSPGIIEAVVDDEDDNKLLRFQVNTNAEAATAEPTYDHAAHAAARLKAIPKLLLQNSTEQ